MAKIAYNLHLKETDEISGLAVDRRHEYGVVRIPIKVIKAIGLSVQSTPSGGIIGHVVIPELNAEDYQADKAKFTPIKLMLAEEASKRENILIEPVVE